MGAGIHTCPTCKKTYTGIVCGPCFAKHSEPDRKGFFRGLISNDLDEIKIKKFHAYYHNFNQDLKEQEKHTQMKAIEEEPRLKVFQITMIEPQEFVDLVIDVIVALGADEESVCKLVWGNLGYDATEQVKGKTYRVVEVEGPFGQGSLLYRHKVIND